MADIKLREVNRGTIKTLDRSIAASNRIRNASEEIRNKSKDVQRPDDGSLSEYAAGRLEYGMQEGSYMARRSAAKATPHIKTGAKNAVDSARIRYGKSQLKKQRAAAAGKGRGTGSKTTAGNRAKAAGGRAKAHYISGQSKRKLQLQGLRAKRAAGQTVKTARHAVRGIAHMARAIAAGTKALISLIATGGTVAIVVVVCCVIFGAAFYFFGDKSSSSYIPVSPEVEAYTPQINKYCKLYGIPEYAELVKAVMMQESGGRGTDPMQSSECGFNTKYPNTPGAIKDPDYSIKCGVQYLAKNLKTTGVSSPVDMDKIKLALQGYNFGSGYISWALKNYGGYSKANAEEFSKKQGGSYGDVNYVDHVLRYYPYGNYSYDIIYNGPSKLGLPIKDMKRSHITSHFGPRSAPGGVYSTNHKGLDIGFPTGTKVLACESGTVTTASWYGGYGKCIIIDHGKGLQTLYAHLSEIGVKKGQKVVRGQVIGKVGSTGNSTGPHLHLSVIVNGSYVNPEKGWLSLK